MAERRSLTAWLPSYSDAQCFLRIIEGTSYRQLRGMIAKVLGQTGTPQSPVNWSDPDKWIRERLTGEDRAFALRLWEESDQAVNPRYCQGHVSICETHKLFVYSDDTISFTNAGRKFLENDAEQLSRMDDYDGILLILSEIAAKGPAQRKHIFDAFRLFCHTQTTWRADGSVKDALGMRLENLLQRDLIEKSGRSYRITIFGLDYLEQFGALTVDDKRLASGSRESAPIARENQQNNIFQLAARQRAIAREQLAHHLQSMNPYQFEHLIKRLLEEMDYDNVKVTGGSNDKGVDVVADKEFGISHVREVIQVKRQQSKIGRPILDSLRGSLHRFDAVTATIITTGGYSKAAINAAFEKGVAPITLIDGERLLDLLMEKDIGISRKKVEFLEFDEESLSQFEVYSALPAIGQQE